MAVTVHMTIKIAVFFLEIVKVCRIRVHVKELKCVQIKTMPFLPPKQALFDVMPLRAC